MPVLNRRDLVRSSALLAVGGLISARAQDVTAPHTPPKKVSYVPVDVATFHAAGTVNSLAIASLFRGNATPQDFNNAAAGLTALHTNWVAAGLDTILIPEINKMNESDLTVARMGSNVSWITNNIKSFNPAVTQAKVTAYLTDLLANTVINGVDYKTKTLQTMRAGGTSTLISAGIAHLNSVAGKVPAVRLNATTHQYAAQVIMPSVEHPLPDGGGGSCNAFDLGSFALGLAAVTLTVMTDGLDLLAAAAWEGIAYWAGIGAAGTDITAHLFC
jgi:hypothetical protein